MPSSLKWRIVLICAVTALGIYILIPTILGLKEKREAALQKGEELPWYYHVLPNKGLNLGLDLRGGIYIELQVDLKSAVKRQADLAIYDIESTFKDKGVSFESITQPEGTGTISIVFKSREDMEKGLGILEGYAYYRERFIVKERFENEEKPRLTIGFSNEFLDNFERETVRQATENIRNRVDRYGVAEPDIRGVSGNRIAVEFPGISDPERAIDIIKRTGQLEFKLVDGYEKDRVIFFNMKDGEVSQPQLSAMIDKIKEEEHLPENYSADTVSKINEKLRDKIPEGDEIAFELVRDERTKKVVKALPYLLKGKAEVTGDMLEDVRLTPNSMEQRFEVGIRFNKEGTKRFADLTEKNVGKRLAIVLDGYVNEAAVIEEPILSGEARITLGYGYEETEKKARALSIVLREGALPATLTEATKSVVGPTLGKDSIRQGIEASLIAAVAVVLFMILYYKVSGLFADIALFVNVILLLSLLSVFGATLTLPGIAGIALTVGMAVDANVIINERIREELRRGRTPKSAVENGYKGAMSAVIDSNLTTLISGIVLYQFGTGPIRGFAVTLSIGILTTLFTAIVITKTIFDYRAFKGGIKSLSI